MADELHHIHSRTVETYERVGTAWEKERSRAFYEQGWIDRFLADLPPHGSILDAGCGAGDPIALYLTSRGFQVTGIDAAESMLALARSRLPSAEFIRMDMRALHLPKLYDGILSWDAFFHLNAEEQRPVLKIFADHLAPRGALLLTIGPKAGEALGSVGGEPIYHASLSQEEYRSILAENGFGAITITCEDPDCGHRTVLLARKI